ncbi:retrovirus-related pol polyprotein from transposon TNT 1-94 [Tanacetum coccineum]
MSRTMLNEQSLPQKFWCNAVDTSTYILNRILIRAILGKTPYELLRGRKPTLDYFRVFGSKCFILNTKDYLTKFDPKSYEGVFLGYSQNSKAYIILNKHTRKVEESLNVTFDETPPPSKTSPLVDDDLDEEEAIKVTEKKNLENDIEDETLEIDKIVNIKESRNHPLENNVNEALTDDSWIVAMQEELNQFIANDVWELVDQGYNQQDGIDYDETCAPVARLESIRILLAYACALDFKLFQMDVKSEFLNGFINEEICPRVPSRNFDALPFEEYTISFLRDLGHTEVINSLNDVVIDQIHQPWRTFAAIINRSLSGKTSGLEKLCLSRAQILWVMYHQKYVRGLCGKLLGRLHLSD